MRADSMEDDAQIGLNPAPVNLVYAVKELHALSSQELINCIEAQTDTIQWVTANGSHRQINVGYLARNLASHLIEKILNSKKQDEELYKYLLQGFQLLYTLHDLVSCNIILEQVFLEDIEVSQQLCDLIYSTVVFCGDVQEFYASSNLVFVHSTILASSLHLSRACFSSEWHGLATILLAYPRVDIFLDATFTAIRLSIQFIQIHPHEIGVGLSLAGVYHLYQNYEASLQFVLSLCEQKPFREDLVKHKVICDSILLLAYDILILPTGKESLLIAATLRLKSTVLSIVLHLCEVENRSLLDLTRCLDLTSSIIFEAEVLNMTFSLPHGEFLSRWCSTEPGPSEEDGTVYYNFLAEN